MDQAIAVVGMATWSIAGKTTEEFWRTLVEGAPRLGGGADPAEYSDGRHTVDLTLVDDRPELFASQFFGLSPSEATTMEPQQRVFLELCWEALERAGYSVEVDGPSVGVFAGANFTSYFRFETTDLLPDILPGLLGADKDCLATRVAHHLGLQGPAITVQTACSTSLVAAHLACQAIRAGDCKAALVGGVSITAPRITRYAYVPGAMLSPDGVCRAFDAEAKGTVFREGGGAVLLMPMADAIAGGHPIHALILGSAVNNDGGKKASYTAPSVDGQVRVVRRALDVAGVRPRQIGYIEAHGTGTLVGDAIEFTALSRVFREDTDRAGFCRLGSVKNNIGHTASAAGVFGLVKAALALENETIPPTLYFRQANPELRADTSAFRVEVEATPWPRTDARRFAAVSSFGIGGTNAHIVLCEPPPPPASGPPVASEYPLTLSAATQGELAQRCRDLKDHLERCDRQELADVAFTTNLGRTHLEYRTAITCRDAAEAMRALASAETQALTTRRVQSEPRIAFMFPGQGSHHIGMGRQLYLHEPSFRSSVDECLEILSDVAGAPDVGLLFRTDFEPEQAAALLKDTVGAQPALFVIQYALANFLLGRGLRPAALLGHSIGEYAAATIAGVMGASTALRLVLARGAAMQAMPPGGMVAALCSADEMRTCLPEDAELAAINGPAHCVAAGPLAAMDELEARLTQRDVRHMRLRTSHAFHSKMMEPASAKFQASIAGVSLAPAQIDVASTMFGRLAEPDELSGNVYWGKQIRHPVLFHDGLGSLIDAGCDLLIEVGPGQQLQGLARQALAGLPEITVLTTLGGERVVHDEMRSLLSTLADCWSRGARIDWKPHYAGEKRRLCPLPAYPFVRNRFRTAPNTVSNSSNAAGQRRPVENWLYAPTWTRVNWPVAKPGDAAWLFVSSDRASARRLAMEARRNGRRSVSCSHGSTFEAVDATHFEVNLAEEAELGLLWRKLESLSAVPDRLIYEALPARSADGPDVELSRQLESTLWRAQRLLKSYRAAFGARPLRMDIITDHSVEVTGEEPLRLHQATALAFARIAPQEDPAVNCAIYDAPSTCDAAIAHRASRVISAILTPPGHVYALRGEYLWQLGYEMIEFPEQPTSLRREGVYIVFGGLGQVGMNICRLLAREWNARLVVVGRSPVTPHDGERAALLADLSALGADVTYLQADIEDQDAVRRVRTAVMERHGVCHGVVFAAGRVDRGAPIHALANPDVYRDNFGPKVKGLHHVMTTFGDDLDFGMVFSSISTVLGGIGHLPYAAANLAADAMVLNHFRRGRSPWKTVDWDLWAGTQVSSGGRRALELQGLSIREAEGGQVFERLLAPGAPRHVIVSTHDLFARIEHTGVGGGRSDEPVETHERPALNVAFRPPQGELEARLAKIWCEVLGLETVGRDDDFFELGGHSLLAVQVSSRIEAEMGLGAAEVTIYDHPTIAEFAAQLTPS